MSEDANLISQIKKLHLLQATIYAIGAALFTAALFVKHYFLGFVGSGLMFSAVAQNMLIDFVLGPLENRKLGTERCVLVGQMVLAFVLAVIAFTLACRRYL